jgi:NADH-quinone oxidoreductase subunit N
MTETIPISDVLGYLRENSVSIAPQLQLIIWGLGILCVDPLLPAGRKRTASLVLSLAGLTAASTSLWMLWEMGAGPSFFGMITLDSFARFFDMIFLVAAFVAVLVSYRHLDIERAQHSEYYALLLFATSGMMFLAGALDLLTIIVGLELMAISTYILVGFFKGQRRSNEAALKYFLLGAFSSGILLYGMSLLYGISGSTNLAEIGRVLNQNGANALAMLAVLMMLAGLCFKVAAAPFHMWAPDAYEGAPTGITAFMSVAVKAAAFAVFLRIFLVSFEGVRESYLFPVVVISMLTMTWGNVAAVTQTNVKRLLAYSSISHAGFVLMGLAAGGDWGVMASAGYLLIYTFMNLGVWAVLMLLRRKDIAGESIEDFDGLFFKKPVVAILMLIFLLSLAGIPPLGGFIAKYLIFSAVIKAALNPAQANSTLLVWLAIVGAANAVIALYYYLRIVVAMFIRKEFVPAKLSFSTGLILTLVITGALTILMGLYPEPFIQLARTASLPLI